MPAEIQKWLRRVVPEHPEKDSVYYDMKSRPYRYVHATYLLALLAEENVSRGLEFCPLKTGSIPCHVKLDTEVIAQCFVPYKEAVKVRKDAPDREAYNNWVWSFILDRKKVNRKSRKYRFHHEITTDGVEASLGKWRSLKRTRLRSTLAASPICLHAQTFILEETWDWTQESGTSPAW